MKRISRFFFVIFVCLFFVGCNSSKDIEIIKGSTKINSLEWRAIAEIEEYKTCDENGWEVPEGANIYKEQEEIKSYEVVGYKTKYRVEEYEELVGFYLPIWRPRYETRTKKVSYKEAIKEPIYATKYYYTIDKWVARKVKIQLATGNTTDYSYPEYICNENERIANVEYTYLAKFEFNGREVSYVVDKDKWETLKVEQEIYVEEKDYKLTINWNPNTNK